MARKNKDLRRAAQSGMRHVKGGWEGTTADLMALLKLKTDQQVTIVKRYMKQGFAIEGKSWQWDYRPPSGEPRFILGVALEDQKRLFEGGTDHAAEATYGLIVPLQAAKIAGFISKDKHDKAVVKVDKLDSGIRSLARDLKWRVGRQYLTRRSNDL